MGKVVLTLLMVLIFAGCSSPEQDKASLEASFQKIVASVGEDASIEDLRVALKEIGKLRDNEIISEYYAILESHKRKNRFLGDLHIKYSSQLKQRLAAAGDLDALLELIEAGMESPDKLLLVEGPGRGRALAELADFTYGGVYVLQDYVEAERLALLAVEIGYPKAALTLAKLYRAVGMPSEAFPWILIRLANEGPTSRWDPDNFKEYFDSDANRILQIQQQAKVITEQIQNGSFSAEKHRKLPQLVANKKTGGQQ